MPEAYLEEPEKTNDGVERVIRSFWESGLYGVFKVSLDCDFAATNPSKKVGAELNPGAFEWYRRGLIASEAH